MCHLSFPCLLITQVWSSAINNANTGEKRQENRGDKKKSLMLYKWMICCVGKAEISFFESHFKNALARKGIVWHSHRSVLLLLLFFFFSFACDALLLPLCLPTILPSCVWTRPTVTFKQETLVTEKGNSAEVKWVDRFSSESFLMWSSEIYFAAVVKYLDWIGHI